MAALEVIGAVIAYPAVKKIADRLAGETGDYIAVRLDVQKAKLEKEAQGIRDSTSSNSQISAAITEKFIEQISSDSEIVRRAAQAFSREWIRKQENKDAVLAEFLDFLASDPPKPDAEGPSDDWMNVFEAYAEKASSQDLRQLWARILAGEIRKKGSFSLRTLQFLSVMDAEIAKQVEHVASVVVESKFIPLDGSFGVGAEYATITSLASLGFIDRELEYCVTIYPRKTRIRAGSHHAIDVSTDHETNISLRAAVLTAMGKELITVPQVEDNASVIASFVGLFCQDGASADLVDIRTGQRSPAWPGSH